MKIIKALLKMQELNNKVDEPAWDYWRIYQGRRFKVEVSNLGLKFCEDGDYASLLEARSGAEWLVDQLGGEVKWKQ